MRKFSLIQYFEMMKFCEKLYAYKYSSQAAIGVMRTLNRLSKNLEKEKPQILAERETFLASDEYKKQQESIKEKDDDDDYKYDKDPSGFDLINKVVSTEDTFSQHLDFILKVYKSNSEDSRFYVKAVKTLLKL